jgi:integrase
LRIMTAISSAAALAVGQVVRLPVKPARLKLTNKNVLALPGPDQGTERVYYDVSQPGLALRVTSTGQRTLCAVGRTIIGRQFRLKVAKAGSLEVAAARKAARAILGQVALGADPGADRKAVRAAARARRSATSPEVGVTLGELALRFLRDREGALRASSWWSYRAQLHKHVLPAIGGMPAREVTTQIIDSLHTQISAASGKVAANRVRAVLSAVFSHAVKAKLLERNPVAGSAVHREKARERVLRPQELREVLSAARARGDVAGDLILFLAMTACRRGEALAARWCDFDLEGGTWTKPAMSTKSGKDHVVPLAPEAIALLRNLYSFRTGFPSDRVFPISPASLQRAFRRCCEVAGVPDARIHDLRRSAATAMAMAGAPMPVVGRLLGHAPGSAITARIYARSTSEAERTAVAALGRLTGSWE